ncbi:MAG: hypothetical protein ACREMU_14485, partial [Gemmatimonadaceae bacterium]
QRPIYFARTSGGYARSLGLGDYTLTQGLAAKLFVPDTKATYKDSVFIQGDGWLDIARSDSLWSHVFAGPQSVLNTGDWIDRPSVGIPYLYVATGIELAEALKSQQKPREADSVFSMAKRIATTVRLEELVRPAESEFQQELTGDTARGAQLPGIGAPNPPPAKTDSVSTPGAKAGAPGGKGAPKPAPKGKSKSTPRAKTN